MIATMFWGVIGFTAGTFIAFQLAYPALNLGSGVDDVRAAAAAAHLGGDLRLRRQCAARHLALCRAAHLPGPAVRRPALAWFLFWGYQLFIVMAAIGYLLGITEGREYAEPEWYVDMWLTLVWVAYLAVFFGTILQRKEPHIYVANWFYLSFIVTVAMLHVVNNLSVPVSVFGTKAIRCSPASRMR